MKSSPAKKVLALHGKGWTVAEISHEVGMDAEEVRNVIIGKWEEDKRKSSVAEKVAGRLGKSHTI